MGLHVIGGRNTRIVYLGAQVIGSNASSYTFSSLSPTPGFGEESPRRYIIAAFHAGQLGPDFTKPICTDIGGVAPTQVLSNPDGPSGGTWSQLWIAAVPTNADETLTFSRAGLMTHGLIEVWAGYDLASAVPTDTEIGSSANPSLGDITVAGGGCVVAFATTTSAGAFTWGGVAIDHEATGTGTASSRRYSAAHADKLAAGLLSISSSQAASHAFIAASFR